ncbi:MAG: PQQ-binding-like beta-propeller repeat protein [Planctomycetes bacterium]|nr:PQQ-binding-like beta-propeller repeat protein [Planctomycetota bacterium]
MRRLQPRLTPGSLARVAHSTSGVAAVAPEGVEPSEAGRPGEVVFNIAARPEHPEYMGVLHAAKGGAPAHVTFRIDCPRDVRAVEYGGRFYNRAPGSRIDLLHSFDGGKTWTRSWSLTRTEPPWDVIRYETVREVPAGTRSVLFRYALEGPQAGPDACSIYAVRMEARHEPADPGFRPLEVTFRWAEVQEDYSLIERAATELVIGVPHEYAIDVGGADHPVLRSLRIAAADPARAATAGNSGGKAAGGERFVHLWVTYGRNLAEGRPYTVSRPSRSDWGAGDPDLRKLTDGVVGPPYAGGTTPTFGACWHEGDDPDITVDLGAVQACAAFRIHVSGGWPWWDSLKGEVKDRIEVETSVDGAAYEPRGAFPANLRRKDIPVNHLLPDDETATGPVFERVPPVPVQARFVRFKVRPARILVVSEVQVLDAVRYEPFDLKIALPPRPPRRGAAPAGDAAPSARAEAEAAGSAAGWRGNWNGQWPGARPPVEWRRVPKGPLEDLRVSVRRPGEGVPEETLPLRKGLVQRWLVLGPFGAEDKDGVRGLEKTQVPDPADPRPSEGEARGGLQWRPVETTFPDRWELGPSELEETDLSNGFEPSPKPAARFHARLHAYLRAKRAGRVRAVVDHACGLQVWVNGREVYSKPEPCVGLGYYSSLSRWELEHTLPRSPAFELELQEGWNRLALNVSSAGSGGAKDLRFCLRLAELSTVPYESKNVLWMAELPGRSNSNPIVAGDRIFLMAEPDELLAIDKHTGKVLWSALNNFYECLSPEDRAATSAFREIVDPLVAALRAERGFERRLELRRKVQAALEEIDEARFARKLDGHLESHFGIVGFTTPTPASDGEHVYVWCGNGVAACYDLDGRRRWIRRVKDEKLSYPSSPAIFRDRFVVHMGELIALDPRTGEVLWRQPEVHRNNAALLPATFGGTEVVVCQQGDVVRASDGALLWGNPAKTTGDTGWCAPVVEGSVVYLPWYGIGRLYAIDIYSTLYAVDPASRETLYRQDLGLDGLFHYNAVPVAASPALIGGRIYALDNQGTTVVLEPGRTFREVARNRIATQLERTVPIPAQETTSYAAPVPDGDRLYIRGERYLYAIGEER